MITRRGLIVGGGASLLAAPAIVRACNIMPVHDRMSVNVKRLYDQIHAAIAEATKHHLFQYEEAGWMSVDMVIKNGQIQLINVANAGDGYTTAPVVILGGAKVPDGQTC